MIVTKVRYEIGDIHLRANNMSPKDADSYVLIKATDDFGNEIAFALSDVEADHLEMELSEANRRRRLAASVHHRTQTEPDVTIAPQAFGDDDQLSLERT
ncbi:hypothetical protein E5161_08035 [Cohnella pontilimi]|uniref:Uncharacterized protein n=1 Tax=Cohnella pontilimi TaxID=2564100 RepID=A0A4U0FDD9_9BACL|nr:hypothetical protein [Cohnella pontilimi]TJY42781.1 hypothetical protein E5161_08035 [Cohnella pontilimi]